MLPSCQKYYRSGTKSLIFLNIELFKCKTVRIRNRIQVNFGSSGSEYRQQELLFRPDISIDKKEEPFLVLTLMLSSVKYINEFVDAAVLQCLGGAL
jgi:hypothetical protein